MDIFSLIKKSVSIEVIVSEYTSLKKAGSYLKARCPFHHEKTASFTISLEKGIFYCFGCHKGGDVIYFVSIIEQCSQKEAALLIATKYNIEIPKNTEEYKNNSTEKEKYFFVYSVVVSWLKLHLSQSTEAKNYIVKKREISEHIVSQFNVGYFPPGVRGIQSLIEFCKKESILVDDLISCHIIMPIEKFYYSPFEDRIIFPIQDTLARFCGLGGRIFKEHDSRAKYYNSQESDFFQKGNLLFGLSFAKEHIRTKKTVFIVEGYIDCILMAQYGYQNTVATLGTACSEHQLKQLSRYTDTLYFLYDGDKAGKQALLRVTEKCWKVNLEPFVIILPSSYDPASYILEKKTVNELLENTYSIFSFFIQEHSNAATSKTLQEKIQAITTILQMILQIPDAIKQTLLLTEAANTLEIDTETLKKEFSNLQKKQLSLKKQVPTQEEKKKDDQQEKIIKDNSQKILAFMLCNPTTLDLFLIELCHYSPQKEIQAVAKKIIDFLKNIEISPEHIFDHLWNIFDEQEKITVSKLITEYGQTLNIVDFKQFCQQFERQMFKKIVQFIKMQFFGKEEMLKELLILQKRFKREI